MTIIIAVAVSVTAMSAKETGKSRFNLATYNIRFLSKSDSLAGNNWHRRCPEIAKVVRLHEFDIFGTQEGLKYQLETLKAELPGYDYIGVGRTDGKSAGEHSAIYYDTTQFDVVDHGDFWLSETPDKPGLGWDAACYRICTWGRFRHRQSGREFLYFNLHMDHVGKTARIESGKLIQRKIKEFGSDLPTFLSGDFNVDQNNECYRSIVDAGVFRDSHSIAGYVHEPNGTWNDWKPNGFTRSRIDHIFVTDGIEVKKYAIFTDHYFSTDKPQTHDKGEGYDFEVVDYTLRTPSDHYPVMVAVEL